MPASNSANPSLPVTFRPVSPEDEEFLFALYASTRKEELAQWGWPQARQQAFLALQFKAQRRQYLAQFPEAAHSLLILDGAPIGRLWVDRANSIRLVDITLLPERQHQGLGTSLIQLLQAEAAACSKPLELSVLKSNVRALRLYQRLGFAIAADGGMYLAMIFPPKPA
ncbi:MAG: GNAT family N-acetyltransferase [Planctomycetota bacterium]